MININSDHTYDFYMDGSLCEREYFCGVLIYMRFVRGYYTSITRVVHGVSVIAIKDWRKEMKMKENENF